MKTTSFSLKLLIPLAGVVVSFSSCDEFRDIDGNGHLVSDTRQVADFTTVVIEGEADVYLHHSESSYVEVTTDENLMDRLDVYVSGYDLHVGFERASRDFDATALRIHVYGPQYSRLELHGSHDLHCLDSMTTSSFTLEVNGDAEGTLLCSGEVCFIEINGKADLRAAGSADEARYSINGSGRIDALDLEAAEVDAEVNGSGDLYVHCTEVLNAEIHGSGDIYYLGTPVVNADVNGTGQVEPY